MIDVMPRPRKMALYFHAVALFAEALGTALVYFDSVRIDAWLHTTNLAGGSNEAPPGFESWIYHSSFVGFLLLLLGILFSGILLWFEHRQSVSQTAH